MTKILLSALVAAMLVLTGLVAYKSVSTPDVRTIALEESTPACCEKESCASDELCPACAAEKAAAGCCQSAAKSACCGGEAAVKPQAITAQGEKKD